MGIVGYSHGGGSVYNLDNALGAAKVQHVTMTSYVDAVEENSIAQEDRRPTNSTYHLNIYQENGAFELGGGPIPNLRSQDDEIDVTATSWGINLTHFTIDDATNTQNLVKFEVRSHVSR